MNSPTKIISINVIPKLRSILREDISVLKKLCSSRSKDSQLYDMLTSLIQAKVDILNDIPSDEMRAAQVPMPPSKMSISNLSKTSLTEIKDQYKLPKILLEIEKGQMTFIQKASQGVGLPSGLQQTLDNVLEKYIQITSQLDRSIKTNQLNAIVIS